MMHRLLLRLELLRKLHKSQQTEALAASLRVCADTEAELLAVEMLRLAKPTQGSGAEPEAAHEALLQLAINWSRLGPELRDQALELGRGRWGSRVGLVPTLTQRFTAEAPTRVRESLVTIAGEAGITELAMPLVDALADTRVGRLAEQSLLMLASMATGLSDREQTALIREGLESDDVLRLPKAVKLNQGQRNDLESALVQAGKTIGDHRRRGVLLAMAIVLDGEALGAARRGTPGPVLRWLTENDDSGHMVFRSVARRSKLPVMRQRAWEWLNHATLARLGLERLAHAYSPLDHEMILSQSHLVIHPARAGAVRALTVRPRPIPRATSEEPPRPLTRRLPGSIPADSPLPDAATAARLSVPARRGLARWISSLPMEPQMKFDSLVEFLADPDPMARYAASRELGPEGCGDFCFDSDPSVARSSALSVLCAAGGRPVRLDQIVGDGRRFVKGLARSPHGSVRRLAEEEAGRFDPWIAGSPQSRLMARRQLLADRDAFLGQLRHRVANGSGEVRLQALMLARHLGVVHEIELEVLALAGADSIESSVELLGMDVDTSSDQERLRLAATAVGVLGDATSTAAYVAARGCLSHTDARVRANAVESVLKLGNEAMDHANEEGLYSTFLELKDDDNHRVRANAIRGLLGSSQMKMHFRSHRNEHAGQLPLGEAFIYEPKGIEALASMLGDDRSMHRVAALWLAQRTLAGSGRLRVGRRWTELAARVSDMSAVDTDQQVRRRAQRCNRRLMAEIRTDWRDRVALQTQAEEVS